MSHRDIVTDWDAEYRYQERRAKDMGLTVVEVAENSLGWFAIVKGQGRTGITSRWECAADALEQAVMEWKRTNLLMGMYETELEFLGVHA